MLDVESLNGLDAAETLDLAINALEGAGGLEHALPAVLIVARHVVVGVVARDDHKGTKDDLVVARGVDGLDDVLARGLLGLALDGADKDVLVAEVIHLGLHLAVGDGGLVGGAVAHEDERDARVGGGVKGIEAGGGDGRGGHGDGDALLVGVDSGSVGSDFAEERLGDDERLELIGISLCGGGKLVVLGAVHEVGRLYDEVLDAVGDGALKSLLHVVYKLAVAGLDVVDDDLRGEGAAHGPVGERGLQGLLDTADIGGAAVVERSAEADDEQFVLADAVGVEGIVLRGVAGVSAEVIGIGFLTLDELLLSVGQRVPGGLGGGALRVGLVRSLLDVDRVYESGDGVGGFLIGVAGRLRLGGRLCSGSHCRLRGAACQAESHESDDQRYCEQFLHTLVFLLVFWTGSF